MGGWVVDEQSNDVESFYWMMKFDIADCTNSMAKESIRRV